ncbi:MAG TPA: cellulose biosynthesis protein CelD, partial [Thermoanaerobaculia bacterium]|nr:cellulose biosynthesis protein CelD [Thermoanaerobaculia bacterium]
MTSSSLTIDVVSDSATFAAMRDEWNELLTASAADSLFLTWEWLHTWWKHLRGSRQLFLVTVRDGSRLVAIAPLTSRPTWMGNVIEFAGSGTIGSDYLDIIVRRGWEA